MKLQVWKWYHNWGDDSNILLFASSQAAWKAIHQYVQENWEEGATEEEEFSGDAQTDVQKYFELHDEEEWFSLDSQTVDFPNLQAPLAEDEVILNPEECQAICILTKAPNADHFVQKSMALPGEGQVGLLLNKIHEKLKD
jgi:hypothetical protein